VRRGEIWTISGGPDYAAKPRPAIIVQSDRFDATTSVSVCPLTTAALESVHVRFPIQPTLANGLLLTSYAMVDKISTLPRVKLGRFIGRIGKRQLALLNQRMAIFLGLGE
jgi:mRNA interferase MazF